MLQLFEDGAIGSIGRPATLRSALSSFLIHAATLLFVLSLAYSPTSPALPSDFIRLLLVAPPPPPPLRAPQVETKAIAPRRAAPVSTSQLTAPVAIPPQILLTEDETSEALPEVGELGGVPGGVPGGVLAAVPVITLPPPIAILPPPETSVHIPEPPVEPPHPIRIHVRSDLQEAQLLVIIRPEYPRLAKAARVQGAVHMKAIIDREGKITDLKLIDGHPLLASAALAAVGKWRYRPTLLKGEPVEVATEIVVNFRLEGL